MDLNLNDGRHRNSTANSGRSPRISMLAVIVILLIFKIYATAYASRSLSTDAEWEVLLNNDFVR